MRALAYAVAIDIHPVCNLRVAQHAVAASNGAITMEGWMRAFISPGLYAFEQMVGNGDYCYGQKVSMADVCLVPQLYNALRWGIDLDPMPRLRRIGAKLGKIPAFAAAHPDGLTAVAG